MPTSVTMTDRQHVEAMLVLLDADGQEVTTLPPGAIAAFESSDPAVAIFTLDGSLHGEVRSGKPGAATITGTVQLADGRTVQDTLAVEITPSEIVAAEFRVGTPEDDVIPGR